MRTKKVNRYWCDFCGKAGLQAGAMRTHEEHCTLNPARTCRVCKMIADPGSDFVPAPLADLIAMLPDPEPFKRTYPDTAIEYLDGALTDAANAALPAVSKAAGNCPACIMAAIRQAKIPMPMVSDFDFSIEMKAIWSDINASDARYD